MCLSSVIVVVSKLTQSSKILVYYLVFLAKPVIRKVKRSKNPKKNMNCDQSASEYTKPVQSFLCRLLYTFGLWKPFDKSKWIQNVYACYSVVLLTTFSIIYATLMVMNIFFLTDVADLSNRLFMSLTEAALAIKVINFFFNNRKWQRILSDLNDFHVESENSQQILSKKVRIVKLGMFTFFYNVQVCAHASGIIQLFSGAKDLLYSGWYPLDWEHNRTDYWIVYFYQYIGIIITANLNVAIDAYYWFVIHVLCAEISIIGHRISSIRFDDKKDSIVKARLDLIELMHTHQRLIEIFKMIQQNVQWAYFAQMMLSSIVICSMTREMAEVSTQ